jgi:CRISPR-associated exonuclease Cas4
LVWALLLAVVLIALSALLLAWAARVRKLTGLPDGRLVSRDTDAEEQGRPLYSARYGLTGTPDYVVRTSRGLVPVEVKPGRNEAEPHESHLLQVLAYCLLLEEEQGKAPPYGLLRYSSQTFKVDYNSGTRAYLLAVMDDMRHAAESDDLPRNHNQAQRCRACAYGPVCDESLWVAR